MKRGANASPKPLTGERLFYILFVPSGSHRPVPNYSPDVPH